MHVKCTCCDHQCVNERIWSQLTKGSLGWKTDWNGGMDYRISKIFFLTQLWPILAYVRASSKGNLGIQQACFAYS